MKVKMASTKTDQRLIGAQFQPSTAIGCHLPRDPFSNLLSDTRELRGEAWSGDGLTMVIPLPSLTLLVTMSDYEPLAPTSPQLQLCLPRQYSSAYQYFHWFGSLLPACGINYIPVHCPGSPLAPPHLGAQAAPSSHLLLILAYQYQFPSTMSYPFNPDQP